MFCCNLPKNKKDDLPRGDKPLDDQLQGDSNLSHNKKVEEN